MSDDITLKIRLGLGIPVAVIGLALLAIACRFRHAKKRNNTSEAGDQEEYKKPELQGHEILPPAELETHVPELPVQILKAELPEQGIVAELPAPELIDTDLELTGITVTGSERPGG